MGVLASRNWWRERGIILNVEVITMALFIRKRPQERCSPAEIEVAELLTELDDRWLIRWGFIYRDKHGTPREGDFLISGPDGGALVLEVKGARYRSTPTPVSGAPPTETIRRSSCTPSIPASNKHWWTIRVSNPRFTSVAPWARLT